MTNNRHFETDLEFSENINYTNYLDQIEDMNILPFQGLDLYFSDNLWDFSSYTSLNVAKRDLKFNFLSINEHFRPIAKKYIISKFIENTLKLSSMYRHFGLLRTYFNFLLEHNVYDIQDVTNSIFNDFWESNNDLAYTTIRLYKGIIMSFYEFYEIYYQDLLSIEMRDKLHLGNARMYKAVQLANKTRNIDDVYFDKLIQAFLKVIDDRNEKKHFKAAACVLLLTSQTGLRISEVLELEINALETINISNSEETNYLSYKTWKRENGENIYSTVIIFINSLAKKAYTTLDEIHRTRRETIGSKYLYMGNIRMHDFDYFPVDSSAFQRTQRLFYSHLDKHIPTLDISAEDAGALQTSIVYKTTKNHYKRLGRNVNTVTFPTTTQFRVHVCSELYAKGVPLEYIQKFMGHLSHEMQGYYVRPKNQLQENQEFSKRVLEDIITGNLKLLGGGANDLLTNIKCFIEKNNYNVKKDFDTIIDSLEKKIPIRQKFGGVCIKGSQLRPCPIDSKTDKFYCAYGVCSNIFHFFYNIDISYRQAAELDKSIHYNIENGFTKQAKKEKNSLQTVVTVKLEPELKELENVLRKRNINDILIEYPNISHIIKNLDAVKLEVKLWKILAKK